MPILRGVSRGNVRRDGLAAAQARRPPTRRLALWPLLLGLVAAAGCAQPEPTTPAPPRRTAANLGPTEIPTQAVVRAAVPVTEPGPTHAPIPPVSPDEHIRGPLAAPATLLLYSDFDCALCSRVAGLLAQLQERHPQDVRLVFRQFPWLTLHDKSSLAGQVAELADEQAAFWLLHDRLFEAYPTWSALSPPEFIAWALGQAEDLGLDVEAIRSGLEDGRYADDMEQAFEQGQALGVPGSPFLIIDGEPFLLPYEANYLEAAVRLSALRERQFSDYPPFEIDPEATYLARLQLDAGQIVVQLYPSSAPLAVNSFVYLARHGWFDGNVVYRVVPGVLLETGDPTATGLGEPGYHFAIETDPRLGFGRPGMVALVPTSPETNAARFFISLGPLPDLDGARTIFGRVLQGLDLLTDLPARDPLADLLEPPAAVLLHVEVEEQP
jgi:cyclophilin family peptidyl-prolyl cis-trans isomerase/protein-disulfide isomerase